MTCEHREIAANVEVNRLCATPGGPIVAFSAELRIWCHECDEAFVVIAPEGQLPLGLSPRHLTISVDRKELRVPVRPESAPAGWGEGGPGFGVDVLGPDVSGN